MDLKSLLKNTVLMLLFGIFVMLLSVFIAILVVRTLPMTTFLATHANNIRSAPGAQFINAVFPVPGVEQSLRARWSPWLPALVGLSIARKVVKPLDNVLKKFFPPHSSRATDPPSVNNLLIPEVDQDIVNNLVQGNASALSRQSGKLINVSLSLLFLLVLLFCLLFTVSLIRKLIQGTNAGSKKLARSGNQLRVEMQALPGTWSTISKKPRKVTKKKSVRKKSDE